MSMKKVYAFMLSLLLVISMLSGCGGSPSGGNTADTGSNSSDTEESALSGTSETKETSDIGDNKITVWYMNADNFAKSYAELFAKFQEENPDIELETVPLGWDDFTPKLVTAFASGTEPDILEVPPHFVQEQLWGGKIAKVSSEYFPNEYLEETFYQEKLKEWQVNGEQYGFPSVNYMPASVLIYNKQIMEDAGVELKESMSWDELMTTLQTLVEKDGDTIVRGAFSPGIDGAGPSIISWIYQCGGTLLNEDESEFTFTSEASKMAFQTYIDIFTKYGLDDYAYQRAVTDVVDGTLASAAGAPYMEGIRASNYPDGESFGWYLMPPVKKEADPLWAMYNAFGRCVTTKGDKDASWRYMEFMERSEHVALFSIGAGQSFVMPVLYEDEEVMAKVNDGVKAVQSRLQYGRNVGNVWNSTQVDQLISSVVDAVIINGTDLDTALADAQEQGNAMLDEYRSRYGVE